MPPVGRPRGSSKPRQKPGSSGLRGYMAAIAGEEATLEIVRETVLGALSAEGSQKCVCPDCGKEFKQVLPDVMKRLDAAIAVLEQVEGKATQTPQGEATVIIERPK